MAALDLPPGFLLRMKHLLGEEFQDFLDIFNSSPCHGLRVNTLKLPIEQFINISPFSLSPLPWCTSGFLVPDDEKPGKNPYHAAGLYYLQDPSAMAVVEILAPQPFERVLDLAAAPGGKTTHLASMMNGRGLLVANEIKTKRIGHLTMNLERWGARNVLIANETPERLAGHFGAYFDRVLVDAPCSGEGMFRKDPTACQDWSEGMIQGCAVRQTAIMHYAARLVRPGGWLVYSTCTFNPEENESTITRFIREHADYSLVDPPRWPGFTTGRPDWLPDNETLPELRRTIRLWPHRLQGEGHFIAMLHRDEPDSKNRGISQPRLWRTDKLPRSLQQVYETFCRENLNEIPAMDRLAVVGFRLYQLPEGMPRLNGLRVIHPGWWLGTFKKDRFEPAHALALSLKTSNCYHLLSLPADSPELLAYLRCENLDLDSIDQYWSGGKKDGWVVVAVQPHNSNASPQVKDTFAFPMGWGKRVHGILKNHYPRGLQWK